jgi:hypothetical protein
MDWLKNHVYLASWASPCIAVLLAIVKSNGVRANIDILGFVLCAIALGSFAALISTSGNEKIIYIGMIIFTITVAIGREARRS